MAKKVTWTTRSTIDRSRIYKYWFNRNRSKTYSEKLENLFEKSAEIIAVFPHIGMRTEYRGVFSKVVGDYKIFYRVKSGEIQVLRVWDTRQNPDESRI